MTVRSLTPLLALLLVLSTACGGRGDSAGEQMCVTALTGLRNMTAITAADDQGQALFAKTVCDHAAQMKIYDESDATWALIGTKLRQSVNQLLDPYCVERGNTIFEAMPESMRAEFDVRTNAAEWGREFCRGYFDKQYFTADGKVSEAAISRFITDHLSLFTPILIWQFMDGYQRDSWTGLSRVQYHRVVEETVDQAAQRGMITGSADTPFLSFDQAALQELFRQTLENYRRTK